MYLFFNKFKYKFILVMHILEILKVKDPMLSLKHDKSWHSITELEEEMGHLFNFDGTYHYAVIKLKTSNYFLPVFFVRYSSTLNI